MEQFVRYAVAKGLRAYGVSSHAPVSFNTRWAMHYDDFPEYLQEFYRLKKKYSAEMELYVGLELDYLPEEKDAAFRLYENEPLDYRIGAIHYIDNLPTGQKWNIDGDPQLFYMVCELLYDGDIRRLVKRYFEQLCRMISSARFDIVAHLDKVAYNAAQFRDFDSTASWYTDLITETLKLVKEKDLIVEINTKSVASRGVTFPNRQFYPLMRKMKIPVMVNSDCHYPDGVITGMKHTYEALGEAGFRTVRILKGGKFVDMPIN
jgi:histidinol-phosphatase (PHP family)